MSLLVISPDFASHYAPLAVLARAARGAGHRVVVATGPNMRRHVEADGLEWRELALGAGSNSGIASCDPSIRRFIDATRDGAIATIRHQALEREHDLLWQPEQVAQQIARLCDQLDPDRVLVDHVSFGSTLGMYAGGRPFITLVPGHPSQLPVGAERYGVPAIWPLRFRPDPHALSELDRLVDRVTGAFTDRWNSALAAVAPDRPSVADAFRVHGDRVLYNSVAELQIESRQGMLPDDHRFVGPLVRSETLPERFDSWARRSDDRPQVYVALGTFLSYRGDVLARVAAALADVGARAAIATGATPPESLGCLPDDWIVAPQLPQVAMLDHADVAVHHGGNNSVQEALAAGVRQVVLPFSTDQFSNAADLERTGAACVLSPNDTTAADLALTFDVASGSLRRDAAPALEPVRLVEAMFDERAGTETM
jgi:zeaxanthin glucosyltransferase